MTWFLAGGAILCAWAMLRTMGGERERRVLEQRLANPPKPVEPPPGPNPPPAPAQRSTPSQQPQQRRPRQAA